MAEKPPIQKPPVRAGQYSPPPQIQPAYQPVYASYPASYPAAPPEPAPVTAPSTNFLAVLGWTSMIWAVGLIGLCLVLRAVGSDEFGLSLATVSMYLSFVIIPIALLVGLFAIFEIGRETTGDAPKPTLFRFSTSSSLIVLGIISQVGFSHYLTSSAAAALVERLAGNWERTDTPPQNQFGFNQPPSRDVMKRAAPPGFDGEFGKGGFGREEIVNEASEGGPVAVAAENEASKEAQSSGWSVEFTKGGTVTMTNPAGETRSQYQATGNRTLSVHSNQFHRTVLDGDFQVEFVSKDEIIISATTWFSSQSQLSGRYRRSGAATIDPAVPEEFAPELTKLREQLREFEAKSKKLMTAQAKLEHDRTKLTRDLREMGMQSAEDINRAGKQNKQVDIKVSELLSLTRHLKTVQTKRDDCDLIILKIQSALRQIDRQIALKQADVSDITDVSDLLSTLKARLEESDDHGAVKAMNDQALLEEALGK